MGVLTPCQNGDILIDYEDSITRSSDTEIDFDELSSTNFPDHMMVFGRLETGDNRFFLHAGHQKQEAGTSDQRLISGVRASQYEALNGDNVLVLRITDQKLRQNFVKVTEEYARRVSGQKLREAASVKHYEMTRSVYLPTPLYQPGYGVGKRRADKTNHPEYMALFRNLRAYIRFNTKDAAGMPAPLSKNWGVECSQFVAYAYMIANIMTVFPNGLPDNILKCTEQIDTIRHYSDENVEPLLEKLYKEFSAAMGSDESSQRALSVLSDDVKHSEIELFCRANVFGDTEYYNKLSVEIMGTLNISNHGDKKIYQIDTVESAQKLLNDESASNSNNETNKI